MSNIEPARPDNLEKNFQQNQQSKSLKNTTNNKPVNRDNWQPAKKGKVRDCSELLAWLRDWLVTFPDAKQLNGDPTGGSAPGAWIGFDLSGFTSPSDDFKTTHDHQFFSGESYNGKYFLPGDFKQKKVKELVNLLEAAESCCDVFQTSATFETTTLRKGSCQKRALVLRGYRNAVIDGGYIYKIP